MNEQVILSVTRRNGGLEVTTRGTGHDQLAAILVIALVAGAVKVARERRRRRNRCEALDKTIQLWEAIMAKQAYEMPESEWNRLRPFYTVTVEVLKKERDRTEKRGGKTG